MGQCGRQNMLRPYLKIWEWEWIFGCAVKAIFSLGVRSECFLASHNTCRWHLYLASVFKTQNFCFKTTILVEDVLFYIFVTKIFLFLAGIEFYNLLRYIFIKKCVISCHDFSQFHVSSKKSLFRWLNQKAEFCNNVMNQINQLNYLNFKKGFEKTNVSLPYVMIHRVAGWICIIFYYCDISIVYFSSTKQ